MWGRDKTMKKFKHQITGLLAGFIYASLGLVPAYADDTEIYFGGSFIAASEETRPNILFVLDTSGSMKWDLNKNSGSNYERLNALKTSMKSILSSTNNVNMGIMRFTNPGGPVLHPIAYIDKVTGGLTTTVTSRVGNSQSDVTELVDANNTVSLNGSTLEFAKKLSQKTTKSIRADNNSDLATEWMGGQAQGTVFADGCPQLIDRYQSCDSSWGNVVDTLLGVRFRNLGVPPGALIDSAAIEFTIRDQQNNGFGEDSSDVSVTIHGERADTGPFLINSLNNISSRDKTSAVVGWPIISNPAAGAKLTTTDLSSIIQEQVNQQGWSNNSNASFIFSEAEQGGGRREIVKAGDNTSNNRPKLTVTYATTSELQRVGVRFTKVNVPSKAIITNAYIEFTAERTNNESATYTIAIENTGNAAEFSMTDGDVANREWTGASEWDVEPWEAGSAYNTPNLKNLVQSAVNHADWCGGKAMAFKFEGNAATGRRVAKSFDGAPGAAPRLVVEYETRTIPTAGGCAIIEDDSYQVSAGSDDAEQQGVGKQASTSSSTLNLESDEKYIGVRFNGINVPQGAEISSAVLRFRTKNSKSGSAKIKINAQDIDDALTFSRTQNDLSSRSMTTKAVTWTLSNWSKNQDYDTVDVSSLLQAVVGRTGWAAGNSVVFRLEHMEGSDLQLTSFNDSQSNAPRLLVSYQTNDYAPAELRTVRDDLKAVLENEIIANGGTPIVSTYHEAALYMRGDDVRYGASRAGRTDARISVPSSYEGGEVVQPNTKYERIDGNPKYISPIEYSCQENHIVYLTDGEPDGDSQDVSAIEALINKECTSSGQKKCGVDLAEFLADTDQNSELAGKQTVTTHTIALVGGQSAWLEQIATKGGGGYHPISGDGDVVAKLTAAFNSIVGSVLDVDTSFASPAVAISRFNRLIHRNEIYYAVFKPLETPNWPGNLKKFGLSPAAEIVDVNGKSAVEFASGAFVSTSQSYWSTVADGNDVLSGGAASVMPAPANRKIYTYHETSSSKDMTANDNLLVANNSEITKTMLDIGTATDQERTNLINWIRGVDVKDEDGNPTTDARFAIGDPLHSRPIVVTYKTDPNGDGDPSDDEYYIFFGTNAGMLHAINGSTGVEKFALVPDELLKNFKTFYENRDGAQRPYGLDGEPTVWVRDIDNDGNIEADDGDRVYLYVGMRRGGRSYFAYDITDINTPKFLWKVEGGSEDFGALGQSWSKPLLTTVRFNDGSNAVNRTVLFFGGGYDPRQDNASVRSPDEMGHAVYMVDAVSGELLWEAKKGATGNAEDVPSMLYSIPTQLAGADINGDGVLDTLFYGDMGGQLFRTDFDSTGSKTLAEFSSTALIATLSDDTAAGARRFYHAPDIALTRNGTDLYLTVVIGSGYRAHPLDTTIVDRFYAIKQPIFTPGSNVNLTENDLYDATENEVQVGEDPTDEEVAAAAAAKAALKTAKGWYITMENTGEKVLSRPTVIEGTILFTTYEPAAGVVGCTPVAGQNRSYLVNIMDASAVINRDNIDGLDKRDRSALLNVLGIVGEGTLVTTGEKSELKCGTQDCGLVLDGANTVRTFWFQQE